MWSAPSRKLSRSSRIAGNVRMKSPKAPPRITRMWPGMDEEEVLWCSLKLNPPQALAFPGLRPVPGQGASCLLGRTPLFVLRTTDEPEHHYGAKRESNSAHQSYWPADW